MKKKSNQKSNQDLALESINPVFEFKRIFKGYVLRHKKILFTAIFLMILTAMFSASYAYIIGEMLEKIFVQKNIDFF